MRDLREVASHGKGVELVLAYEKIGSPVVVAAGAGAAFDWTTMGPKAVRAQSVAAMATRTLTRPLPRRSSTESDLHPNSV